MARTILCDGIYGTGTFKNTGLGAQSVLQIHSTGSFSATLSATTLQNGTMTQILQATANDFYVFNALTDATFELNIISNSGSLSAVLS